MLHGINEVSVLGIDKPSFYELLLENVILGHAFKQVFRGSVYKTHCIV